MKRSAGSSDVCCKHSVSDHAFFRNYSLLIWSSRRRGSDYDELERDYSGSSSRKSVVLCPGHKAVMTDWPCRCAPKQSVHENRIYSLSIECTASYPDTPPNVKFTSRINLPAVGPDGKVCQDLLDVTGTAKKQLISDVIIGQLLQDPSFSAMET